MNSTRFRIICFFIITLSLCICSVTAREIKPDSQPNISTPSPVQNEITLPQDLQNFNQSNVHVHQLQANEQEKSTCGNHAVFNAVAIQELFADKKRITSSAMQKIAKEFYVNMKPEDYSLTSEDIYELGETLQLQNTHIVAYDKIYSKQFYSAGNINAIQDLSRFYEQLSSSNKLSQFIVNTSDHWVTVSVIKQEDQVDIYYVNSKNTPLVEGSYGHLFLTELCLRLI